MVLAITQVIVLTLAMEVHPEEVIPQEVAVQMALPQEEEARMVQMAQMVQMTNHLGGDLEEHHSAQNPQVLVLVMLIQKFRQKSILLEVLPHQMLIQ